MAAMSFQKKLITLSVVIGVLVAAFVLGLIFSPASVRKREIETPLVARLEADAVAEIRLQGPEGSIALEKRGDEWLVPMNGKEYPAAESRIEALLDFLVTTKRSRLITSNPEAWEDFGVGASAAQKVELLDATGGVLLGLILGKVDEGRGGTYVRLEGSNDVILVNRMFDYYLNTAGRFWSYLRVFPADLEGSDINRISVKSSGGFPAEDSPPLGYTLLLGEGRERDWKLVDSAAGVEIDNAKADRLANALAGLEGADFAAQAGSATGAGLASPTGELLVSTSDGRDFRLLVGAGVGEDRYYAGLETGEYLYEVARFRLEALFKPLSELAREQASARGE